MRTIFPASTSSLVSSTTTAFKPLASRRRTAVSRVISAIPNSDSRILSDPLLMVTTTLEYRDTTESGASACSMTTPFSTVSEFFMTTCIVRSRASSLASASSWVSPTSFGIFTSFWDRVVSFSFSDSVSRSPSVSVSREAWVSVVPLSDGLVNRPPSREKNTMTTTTTKSAATTPRPVRTFSSWVVSLSSSCWRDGAFCLPPRPSGTFLA